MALKKNKKKSAPRVDDPMTARARWLWSLASRPKTDRLSRSEFVDYVVPAVDTEASASLMGNERRREWFLRLREIVQGLSSEHGWSSDFNLNCTFSMGQHGPLMVKTTVSTQDAIADWAYKTLYSFMGKLCRCRRQGCGNMFVRHGRQRYCSPQCASRYRVEKYRKKWVRSRSTE
jgi:hypothetical protein